MYILTEAPACGVGACTCIVPTLGDPKDTSWAGIDRIPPTRPPWWHRQYRELKKIFFSAPSKCPIDLFGPVANRTVLERLHDASGFEPSVSLPLAPQAQSEAAIKSLQLDKQESREREVVSGRSAVPVLRRLKRSRPSECNCSR